MCNAKPLKMEQLKHLDEKLYTICYNNHFLRKLFNAICYLTMDNDPLLLARYITSRFTLQSQKEQEKECAVCLCEDEEQLTITLKCGHCFHSQCLNKWQGGSTCPLCRQSMLAAAGISESL
jgi:hypothetical protein